jgi:phospholipid/cholesterol/gamma-HCH transport system substrate-binding protein
LRINVETSVGLVVLLAVGIFMYMGLRIGAFRFDRDNYSQYTVHFADISGLARKADVKIAGVTVGWIESIRLCANGKVEVEADIMILKDYRLYDNAQAIARQDGLLGSKYVEIVPGDPLLSELAPGCSMRRQSAKPASMDELLNQVKVIASNVAEVTESFKDAVGGAEGKEIIRESFDNLHITMKKLASFSEVLERSVVRNEENIDAFLRVGGDLSRIMDRIDQNVLPNFNENVSKIGTAFDRDFNRIANKIEATGEAFEDASVQARDSLRSISSVAQKIDEGKGLLGKLVNEDETYKDLRVAIQGFKNYLTKIERMQIIFDSHFETMHRPAENYEYEDSKGYFNIRIHPNEDHFYQLQLASSQKGFKTQTENFVLYRDPITRNPIDIADRRELPQVRDTILDQYTKETTIFTRYSYRLGLQFGKIFKNMAVRFGLFEGSAGFGVDVDLPFNTNKFRWITSLEAFDLTGWNRIHDRRPHIKWLNSMYILRNIYFTFGADDFASKHNASAFIGGGIRFGDDDIKYLLSNLSGAGGSASFGGG